MKKLSVLILVQIPTLDLGQKTQIIRMVSMGIKSIEKYVFYIILKNV